MLRIWKATINSRNGLAFAFGSEQAVREEIFALLVSVPLAWLIGVTAMRAVELVCAVAFVLVVELLNTAIETFPGNVVAGSFGIGRRDYFELGDEAERQAPRVSFGG